MLFWVYSPAVTYILPRRRPPYGEPGRPNKQQDQLTDEMTDNWICSVTSNFQLLVKGEINMLLFHQRQIDITRKRQVGNNMRDGHSEREKRFIRMGFPQISLDKLSESQVDLYRNIWCCDLVEIANKALVVKPFRREPP